MRLWFPKVIFRCLPSPGNVIPIVLLYVFGKLSLRSPLWTVVSFIALFLSLHIIYKKIRSNCGSFYFTFTLASIIGAHLVYELIVADVMRITYQEYTTNIFLFTLTLFLIYKTKIAVWKDQFKNPTSQNIDTLSDERRKLELAEKQIPYYNFCRRCVATIDGRDHHCVWLNVCIGKANRFWFIGLLIAGSCWIAMSADIFLTSVCYPVSLFSPGLLGRNDQPYTILQHYALIPVSCPEAYVKNSITIGFVTSVYGLCAALFTFAVLIHQLRLLWKGVSYLELKHQNTSRTKNIPVYHNDSSKSTMP